MLLGFFIDVCIVTQSVLDAASEIMFSFVVIRCGISLIPCFPQNLFSTRTSFMRYNEGVRPVRRIFSTISLSVKIGTCVPLNSSAHVTIATTTANNSRYSILAVLCFLFLLGYKFVGICSITRYSAASLAPNMAGAFLLPCFIFLLRLLAAFWCNVCANQSLWVPDLYPPIPYKDASTEMNWFVTDGC